jgi:hypothetical protein
MDASYNSVDVVDSSDGYPMLPFEHTLKYTRGSKVEFMAVEKVFYPPGLYPLMKEFYQEILEVEVVFLVIVYEAAELKIAWQMADEKGELELRRALDKLRQEVARTCLLCGDRAFRSYFNDAITILCTSCKLEQKPTTGKTGTWLDSY